MSTHPNALPHDEPAPTRAPTGWVIAVALTCATAWQPAQAGKVLDGIKQRGQLICGVSNGVAGFSAPDAKGRWQGLDVDVCRALAAATLGSAEKVKFVPLNATQRFASLQSGQIGAQPG